MYPPSLYFGKETIQALYLLVQRMVSPLVLMAVVWLSPIRQRYLLLVIHGVIVQDLVPNSPAQALYLLVQQIALHLHQMAVVLSLLILTRHMSLVIHGVIVQASVLNLLIL